MTASGVRAGAIHGDVHVHQNVAQQTWVSPRQLRSSPAHFTDREAELAELESIVANSRDRSGPALAVISGAGGVGKSALALRWLHATIDRFPDGQLYVDLGSENTEGPVLLSSVLGRFLRAFGVAGDRVPADVGEAAALFRSMTADKRVAVLVENAVSAAQVRTLLPASSASVVVVASRWRLGGLAMDGAGFVSLVPLAARAGAEMLARTVGDSRVSREPDAVVRLVELCGGLPIALSIAGARLTMRPQWPVARVVRDLADEQRRLLVLSVDQDVSMYGVFDLSYQGLSARSARAYRRLGLCPGSHFDVEVAAAALASPVEEADELLDSLVDASLVEVSGTDRYQFHDLVRLHARQCAEQEDTAADRNDVVRGVLRHRLSAVVAADRVVMPLEWRLGPSYQHGEVGPPAFTAAEEALDSIEAELPNLMAALRAGAHYGLHELVWQLCEAMWSLFLYRKHFPDWISAYELGADAAGRCGDDAAKSRMHHHLGLAFHNLRRSGEAVEQGVAALTAARAAGHELAESTALGLVGMANRARGRYDEALDVLWQAVELDRRAGLRRNEALAHRRLGQTLVEAGRIDEAVVELRLAREQAAALPDAHVESNIMVWLADALARAGRETEAVGLLRDAWDTLQSSGSNQYRAQVLMVWGEAAERLDDLSTARDRLALAHELYSEIGAPHVARVQAALERVTARLAARPAES